MKYGTHESLFIKIPTSYDPGEIHKLWSIDLVIKRTTLLYNITDNVLTIHINLLFIYSKISYQ